MKRFILLAIMVPIAAIVSAQNSDNNPAQPKDMVLVSEWVDGNYLVRRYMIRRIDGEAQYDMHYSVSASKLSDLMKGNAAEIADIDNMMASLKSDTTKHVQRIEIKGYASPDGNKQNNEALAMSRAKRFQEWLDYRYLPWISQYKVQLSAYAEDWADCDNAVQSSGMSDKTAVLAILDSSMTSAQKEQKLKTMPQVWRVFREQILPMMRRVDMTIYYKIGRAHV